MKPKFYKKVLKSGMTILFEKRNLPIVAVSFAVKQGGMNEVAREKGISHFIEHLMFKGTKKRNFKQISEEIESRGGELNGGTMNIATMFHCKIPSEHLDVALDVLSDMIKNSKFDKEDIEKERAIIKEEIKAGNDKPSEYSIKQFLSCLYEDPFGAPLIGNYKTLDSIHREEIIKKFKDAYQPNKMILCIVGDANFDEIIKFAEKNFEVGEGNITDLEIKSKNISKIEKRKGIDQASIVFGYHTPLTSDRQSYAAQILSSIMVGGMSSRLFQEIREKRNLAYVVHGGSDINKKFGYSLVYVGASKENVERIKKIILEEFKKVAEGLTENELKKMKEQMIGNYHISMENSEHQMHNLVIFEINGDAKEFYNFEKNISLVKLKDVKELAKKVLSNHSFFVLLPED